MTAERGLRRAALDSAPPDDEPSSTEEEAAEEGWAEYRRGEFFEADEIRRELG